MAPGPADSLPLNDDSHRPEEVPSSQAPARPGYSRPPLPGVVQEAALSDVEDLDSTGSTRDTEQTVVVASYAIPEKEGDEKGSLHLICVDSKHADQSSALITRDSPAPRTMPTGSWVEIDSNQDENVVNQDERGEEGDNSVQHIFNSGGSGVSERWTRDDLLEHPAGTHRSLMQPPEQALGETDASATRGADSLTSPRANSNAPHAASSEIQEDAAHSQGGDLSLSDVLKMGYCISALQPGGVLDSKLRRRQRDDAREATMNVFSTPRPLVAALSKSWFQVLLLVFALGTAAIAFRGLAESSLRAHRVVRQLRFSAMQQRDGQRANAPGISELGVLEHMHHACRLDAQPAQVWVDGATMTVVFDEAVTLGGYFFVTADDDAARDPVKFLVEGSADEPAGDDGQQENWVEMGSSGWRVLYDGSVASMPDHSYPIPHQRLAEVRVSFEKPWPWYVGWTVGQLALAMGILCGTLLGCTAREHVGMVVVQLTWLLCGACRLATAAGFWAHGWWEEAVYWMLQTAAALMLAATMRSSGRHFIYAITGVGVYLIVVESLVDLALYRSRTSMRNIPFLGASLTFLGSVFLLVQHRKVRRATKLIEKDKRELGDAWDAVVGREGPALLRLKQGISKQGGGHPKLARQYSAHANGNSAWEDRGEIESEERTPSGSFSHSRSNARNYREHVRQQAAAGGHSRMSPLKRIPTSLAIDPTKIREILQGATQKELGRQTKSRSARELNLRSPIDSLDQLYNQACVANCLLKPKWDTDVCADLVDEGWAKVCAWALQSRGSFAVWKESMRTGSDGSEQNSEVFNASDTRSYASYTSFTSIDTRRSNPSKRREVEYVRYSDALENPSVLERMVGGVKDSDRAVEKALLCYESDVSHLCDLTRQKIVFDTVSDLSTCFEAMALDTDIVICFVKNFMDHSNDSGFRAVVVYVRLVNATARRLAVDTHVCEIQLVLQSLVQLQNVEQHQRYVAFRNNISARGAHKSLSSIAEAILSRLRSQQKRGAKQTRWSRSRGLSLVSYSTIIEGSAAWQRRKSFVPAQLEGSLQHKQSWAPTVQEEVGSFLEHVCAVGASTHSDALQHHVSLSTSMQHVSTVSTAFSSKAAAAFISKRKWQVLVFALASAYLATSVPTLLVATDAYHSHFSGHYFRFTALQERGGSGSPSSAHIASLALLLHGCPVDATLGADPVREGPTLTLWFEEAVSMDGFSFVTEANEAEKDPVSFILEGRAETSGQWERVGASRWRVLSSATAQYLDDCCYSTPAERNATVEVWARAGWPWFLAFSCVQAVTCCLAYILVILGVLGQSDHSHLILGLGFSSVGILQIASSAGFSSDADTQEATYWILFALGNVGMAFVTFAAEGWFVMGLTTAGAYWVVLDVVFRVLVTKNPSSIYLSPPLSGLGFFVVGSVVLVMHVLQRKRAVRLIEKDQASYDLLWQRICSDRAALDDLKRLGEEVAAARPATDPQLVHQFNQKDCEEKAKRMREQCEVGKRVDDTDSVGQGFQASTTSIFGARRTVQPGGPRRSMNIVDVKMRVRKTYMLFKALGALNVRGPGAVPGLTRHRDIHVDTKNKIQSLDQLFMQAHAANVFLKRKVKHWALHSGGCFPVVAGGPEEGVTPGRSTSFVRWSELEQADKSVQQRIKWGKVKGVDRAIEKVLRTYGGDVSRLVDVCRQSIIFHSIADLLRCFVCITTDADVDIVRIKNRLDLRYDSSESAGYRDLVLNLSINTAETRELFVSTHVCEVQLLVDEFAQMKSDEGHRRYKQFRDERCE